jgi:hypothetical protein
MSTPTIQIVLGILPSWGFKLVDWSTDSGDDCQAIQGRRHLLFCDHYSGGCDWIVQGFTEYDDASVGIFGAVEPGPILHQYGVSVYDAMSAFLRHEGEIAAQEAAERLSEALREEEP